ncbi:MAG: FlgO family outer membrane protein [Pontibacterium sp.]
MFKRNFSLAILMAVVFIGGCTANRPVSSPKESQVDVIAVVNSAAAKMMRSVNTEGDKRAVIAASFVDINNLRVSSTFGRMVSEIFATALTNTGYPVIEVKMRDSLFIKEQAGEFMLSRQMRSITTQHDAQAILLGTYAVGGDTVYLSARVVSALDNIVIASYDFSLPLNRNIKAMLPRQR